MASRVPRSAFNLPRTRNARSDRWAIATPGPWKEGRSDGSNTVTEFKLPRRLGKRFQFLIGNCDAHGKNFSFFVRREGLDPAPWYDLVSVVQYAGIDHELAMAWGDAFSLDEVGAFELADFARRCGVDRNLLKREAARLAKLAMEHASVQALVDDYADEGERAFAVPLSDFGVGQASRLTKLAAEAAKIKPEFL